MPIPVLISVLARSFQAGEPDADSIYANVVRTLGRDWRWVRTLVDRYVGTLGKGARPRHRDVVRFLLDDEGFKRARTKYSDQIRIAQWIAEPQTMRPVDAARSWRLPALATAGDLADWLGLTVPELEWYADLKGLGYKFRNPKLRHYHYHVAIKPNGGVRLIESPKSNLKEVQRRILSTILDRIPPHPASHGFVKGRSIVSFAEPHAGKPALLRLDLQDFFPGFPAARVQALFRTLGYPDPVADLLAGTCTNRVPLDEWIERPADTEPAVWHGLRKLYARPHLPQGAPTSPALANIMAYRLDCRLTGLAASAGASYTRYADDLAFSGDNSFSRSIRRFSAHAGAVALEEGFRVNHRKTQIMRQGVRQRLAGLVVNRKVSVPRESVDQLEAILTNCVRHGPETQNWGNVPDFRAHLEGRIGFVEMVSRDKAGRLRALFKSIEW